LAFLAVPASSQSPDRSAPPKLGPPPSLKLPAIQRFELPNGLKVVLLEKNTLPLVQITLVFNAGSVNDKPDKLGVASMTAAMMDEGAGTRTSLQIAEEIEFYGASLGVGADLHTSTVSLFTPTSKLDNVLPIMADVVMRPTFPENELNRLRKERLTSLLQAHDQPRTIASVAFRQLVYGNDHPYGRTPTGTEASLKAMSVKDLKSFHETYYRPNNATAIVVGNVNRERVRTMLDEWFGGWDPGRVPTTVVPPAPQVGPRTVYLIDKPEAPQSEIRIGRVGLPRKTNEYFPATVMNTVLGGSFTSRLNQNLRETHGYTYGAGSSFDFRPSPGPFMAASAVKTDVTDESLAEFMKELKGILDPVPAEELTRAKNYVALGYPGDFQTVQQIAAKLAEMVVYDLPANYFNTYIDRVLGVTASDVTRAGRSTIDPEKLVIVVVGDRSVIEKDVTALNLGPVKFLTVEEVLGKKPSIE
jgi:predicted Zn-dependent peptidase